MGGRAPGFEVKDIGLVVRREYASATARVNSVDIHPTNPWILVGLESGLVFIWDYVEQETIRSFEVSTTSPVISAKFIPREHWFIAACDYVRIRVYSCVTWNFVQEFTAHDDHVKWIDVHPDRISVLSCGDDNSINLWDWEDPNWMLKKTFYGHLDTVNHVSFNRSDSNMFASTSRDCTMKVWNLNCSDPVFTIEEHKQGINWVDHFNDGSKSYLITASDDCTVKIWNVENRRCVATLNHNHKVSSAVFYPNRPIIITGTSDGTISLWNATNFRLLRTFSYCLSGVSVIACMLNSERVALGHGLGIIVIEMGRAFPACSMDPEGCIIWERQNMIQSLRVAAMTSRNEIKDGESLNLTAKNLLRCELYPEIIRHNLEGKCVVYGDGRYIIYTVSNWKEYSSGCSFEFVWSSSGNHALRVNGSVLQIYNKFNKIQKVSPPVSDGEYIFGGKLLAVCSENRVRFYDWADGALIHQIDVNVMKVFWADTIDSVAIASPSSFSILKYNKSAKQVGEVAMSHLHSSNERVRSGLWAENCFIYINSAWCLNICVVAEVILSYNLNYPSHYLDHPMDLLGYYGSRIYLIDRKFNVVRYTLSGSLNDYMVCVLRGNLKDANAILLSIPKEKHDSVLRFLDLNHMLNNPQLNIPKITEPNVNEKVFKVGVSEARLRMSNGEDFECSLMDELFEKVPAVPAVRNQGHTDSCVFQALAAAGDILNMKKAALEGTGTSDVHFSASELVLDYEKRKGPIPHDAKSRLMTGLDIFEKYGAYAEGGGEEPGRRKIQRYEYGAKMKFGDVASLILDGKPVIGGFKVDDTFHHLKADEIYDFCLAKALRSKADKIPRHCVVFVGIGRRNGRNYLVFLNSYGTSFGDRGYGRVYFEHVSKFSTIEF